MMMNSTVNEYFYNSEENNEATLAESVCVAGVNIVGIGQYSESLTLSDACKSREVWGTVC